MLPSKRLGCSWPLRMNAFSTLLNPLGYDESTRNMNLTTLSLLGSVSGTDSILHTEQSLAQEGSHCPQDDVHRPGTKQSSEISLRQRQHFPHSTAFRHSRKCLGSHTFIPCLVGHSPRLQVDISHFHGSRSCVFSC